MLHIQAIRDKGREWGASINRKENGVSHYPCEMKCPTTTPWVRGGGETPRFKASTVRVCFGGTILMKNSRQ